MSVPKWTNDMDAFLRRCIDDGMSFSEMAPAISTKFQTSLSRNACIGRANRLGLQQSRKVKDKPARPRAPRIVPSTLPVGSIASGVLQGIRRIKKDKGNSLLPDRSPMRCAEVEPLHLSFAELASSGQCKWPFGETTPFSFCGCQTSDGAPYCEPHRELSRAHGTFARHEHTEETRNKQRFALIRGRRIANVTMLNLNSFLDPEAAA